MRHRPWIEQLGLAPVFTVEFLQDLGADRNELASLETEELKARPHSECRAGTPEKFLSHEPTFLVLSVVFFEERALAGRRKAGR